MVAFFAETLRDEPPPKRTPETDPRMTAAGPVITWRREIVGAPYGMSPDGDRYWVTRATGAGGTQLVSVSLDKDADEIELLSVPHHLGSVAVRGEVCAVLDERPRSEGVASTEDLATLMVIDRGKKTQRPIVGPWDDRPWLSKNAIASDVSAFAVAATKPREGGPGRYRALYVVARDGSVRGPVELGEAMWDVEAFGPKRLTLSIGKPPNEAPAKRVDVDLETLRVGPPRPVPEAPKGTLSPDAANVVECSEDGSAIYVTKLTNGASGERRTFSVFEEDRRGLKGGCVEWASPQYLRYGPGFLDIKTMQVNEAWSPDDDIGSVEYDRGFRHAVSRAKKVRVGDIVIRSALDRR